MAEFEEGVPTIDTPVTEVQEAQIQPTNPIHQHVHMPNSGVKDGINLSYTINLNLPATKDIEVFNAIFKSIKQHLIQE